MATRVKTRNGKEITLLNPSEKAKKFASELKTKQRYTNDGVPKVDDASNPLTLKDTQRAYRSGYLAARKDNAKAYKSNLKKSGK